MTRRWILVAIIGGVVAAWIAAVRHRGVHRTVPGGILIDEPGAYDTLTRILLGPLFRGIAADVAASSPADARLLEVGCGPGHLSIKLAEQGLEVTGVDLDPAMIERAEANAAGAGDDRHPSFFVGDAAALPFPDASYDLVVSTFSVHHWADPAAGLGEIGRVLRPGGRALIWDLKPGSAHPFARHMAIPDPLELVAGTPLGPVGATPWRWPWRFELAQRIELVRAGDAGASKAKHPATGHG
jgi:SAM-dependent methyltransferase